MACVCLWHFQQLNLDTELGAKLLFSHFSFGQSFGFFYFFLESKTMKLKMDDEESPQFHLELKSTSGKTSSTIEKTNIIHCYGFP